MIRLAIIGNSHVGALKRAWDAATPRPEGVEPSFFGIPDKQQRYFRLGADLVYRLRTDMGARVPAIAAMAEKINGATFLDVSKMDAVVLCGAPTFQRQFSEIAATYDVDGYRAAGAARRMSRAAFEAICDDLGAAILPNQRWLGATAIPRRAVLPRPLPAEGAATSEIPDYAFWRVLAERPDGARAMIDRLFAGMATAHARHGIDLLRQPAATIEPSGLTASLYTQGSTRLKADERHPEEDVSHMNARYGALCLEVILDWARRDAGAPA